MTKEKAPEKLVRINSRVLKKQQKFIKKYAKDHEISEGQAHRLIIEDFMIRESMAYKR